MGQTDLKEPTTRCTPLSVRFRASAWSRRSGCTLQSALGTSLSHWRSQRVTCGGAISMRKSTWPSSTARAREHHTRRRQRPSTTSVSATGAFNPSRCLPQIRYTISTVARQSLPVSSPHIQTYCSLSCAALEPLEYSLQLIISQFISVCSWSTFM